MSEETLSFKVPARRYWALLETYMRPQGKKVVLLAGLILGGLALQLISPQILRYFIDEAATQREFMPLLLAGAIFVVTALLIQLTTVATTYVGEDVGWTSTNGLRADLAAHCLRLDMSFHNDRTPGEMIERIDGDVANLAIFFSQFIVRVVGTFLLLFGVVIVVAFTDWRVAIVLAIYAIVSVTALAAMRSLATPHWKASRESSAELFGFVEEQLAGTEDIRSNGAQPYVLRNLFRFHRDLLDKERKAGVMNTFMVMTWLGLYTLGGVIALVAGWYLYRGGTMTIGTVYLLIAYTDAIFRPLEQLTEQIQNLQKAAASIERVEELYHTQVVIQDGDKSPPPGALGLTFDGVTFAYGVGENPKPVLRDVSFAVRPGEVLGLLGRTGSGKTTIGRLLFRLYEPQHGRIVLGNDDGAVELRETNLDALRARVGIVTQDVQIFRASVRDNLTLFDRTIGDDQIRKALSDVGLDAWLARQPRGLDTELASGGSGVSAGEAQLLAFTRVFLRDPGLVILDEASSRLDPATEARIEHAIDLLLAGRTCIIIAHRLATVERADTILVLEHGEVVEHGTRADLEAQADSRFAHLLRVGLEEQLA